MVNLLFWNVKRGSAEQLLAAICFENDIDLLILVEDLSANGHIPNILNSSGESYYEVRSRVKTDVRFYSKLPIGSVERIAEPHARISICSLLPPDGIPMLVAGAHFPSKMYAEDVDYGFWAHLLKGSVEQAESDHGHANSVMVGDFNMSPFETGMMAFDGLHAVMDKTIARKLTRRYADRESSFFYNPMWSRMGDESRGPPGTYFYSKSGVMNYFWNTFDQYLIRPGLLSAYEAGSLDAITSVGTFELLKGGRIDTSISDHLPIKLSLIFEGNDDDR